MDSARAHLFGPRPAVGAVKLVEVILYKLKSGC